MTIESAVQEIHSISKALDAQAVNTHRMWLDLVHLAHPGKGPLAAAGTIALLAIGVVVDRLTEGSEAVSWTTAVVVVSVGYIAVLVEQFAQYQPYPRRWAILSRHFLFFTVLAMHVGMFVDLGGVNEDQWLNYWMWSLFFVSLIWMMLHVKSAAGRRVTGRWGFRWMFDIWGVMFVIYAVGPITAGAIEAMLEVQNSWSDLLPLAAIAGLGLLTAYCATVSMRHRWAFTVSAFLGFLIVTKWLYPGMSGAGPLQWVMLALSAAAPEAARMFLVKKHRRKYSWLAKSLAIYPTSRREYGAILREDLHVRRIRSMLQSAVRAEQLR